MKKAKVLLGIFISILILPFTVLAEENQKVNVYFFYGDGCSYCAQAEEFFDSIEDEYGDHYNLVMYETWNNSDNVDLMNEVADLRKEEPEGVPYIIIGGGVRVGRGAAPLHVEYRGVPLRASGVETSRNGPIRHNEHRRPALDTDQSGTGLCLHRNAMDTYPHRPRGEGHGERDV